MSHNKKRAPEEEPPTKRRRIEPVEVFAAMAAAEARSEGDPLRAAAIEAELLGPEKAVAAATVLEKVANERKRRRESGEAKETAAAVAAASRHDTETDLYLTAEELNSLPGLGDNPLVQRAFEVFDTNNNGEVNIKEFIQGLSKFSVGDPMEKTRFAFRIYDIDNDGYISNGELFQVLKMMCGKNLSDVKLQHAVDKAFQAADKDANGKINLYEFREFALKVREHF